MKRLSTLLLFCCAACPCLAQADGCRGALSALVRVKEQITPRLDPNSPAGKDRITVMLSTLKSATNVCKETPELWYYRALLAKKLGKPDVYAQQKLDELNYEAQYDPFTLQPSAEPAPAPGPAKPSPGIRKKWALIVGVDKYQDEHIPKLNFAVKDSNDFTGILTDPAIGKFSAENVIHLTNQQATLAGIRTAIGKLRQNVQKDDLVVIYFSGHGSPRQMDPNGLSYILTYDTKLDGADSLYATSLQMVDLVQQINREIKASRVVLLLDTCYSGDAEQGEDPSLHSTKGFQAVWDSTPPAPAANSAHAFSPAFQNLEFGYGRAVLTASRADEQSWESPKLQNGYFTYFLVQQLRASHGEIDVEELFHHVQGEVSSRVLQDHNAHQTPSFQFSDSATRIVMGLREGN